MVPTISGLILLASVAVVLAGFYMKGGITDVFSVLERVYLWFHVVFGIAFVALADHIKPQTPRRD